MNLRNVVDQLLKQWGHDILLQRRVNPWTEERAVFTRQLERHTTRKMHSSSTYLASLRDEQFEGVLADLDLVYWFRWDVNPTQGDRIYDNITNGVPENQEIYVIDKAVPLKGHHGRVEFWACGCTQKKPN